MFNRAPLQKLPEKISGENVELYALTRSAWERVRGMNSLERTQILKCLRLPITQAAHFANRRSFAYFCKFMRHNEKPNAKISYIPRREYIIWDLNKNCPVGGVIAFMPQPEKNILVIGYQVLPEHRGFGYATEASTILTDSALKKRIFPCICAETQTDNVASARVLVKSGFREAAQGLCSTVDVPESQHLCVRRFIKAPTLPENWPLPAFSS